MATTRRFIAVIGAGAMGAATAWQLSQRGHDVVVHEQFDRLHDRGSSHGTARIFRLGYPDAEWAALTRQALGMWRELQEESGRVLIDHVGGVDHGDPRCLDAIEQVLVDAGTPHERLDPTQAAERWPGMRFDRDVLFHPQAGRINADAAVTALLDAAETRGAEVRERSTVRRVEPAPDSVVIHMSDGSSHRADRAVVTVGPWAPAFLSGLVDMPRLTVTMEQPAMFAPILATDWPTFLHYTPGPPKAGDVQDPVRCYGLPTPDGRLKIGEHHTGRVVDPDDRPDAPDAARTRRLQHYVAEWFPGLDAASAVVEPCLYTTTPTTDFVLDRTGPIVVGAGFSGHGFKFVPRIGRALADLAEE